jgi:ribosomal-protein-serine acetyltransferase
MEHLRINSNARLETVKLSMAPVIFSAIDKDREYLQKWLPFIEYSKQVLDTENFLQSVISQPAKERDEIYSIWHKEEFAGLIGFKETDWINKKTELGYWLVENMQGKGIITSCIAVLIRFAFKKLKLNRVQIKVAVGNSKSAAIPKKLGFYLEGIERAGEKHQQLYHDLEVYSLLANDMR